MFCYVPLIVENKASQDISGSDAMQDTHGCVPESLNFSYIYKALLCGWKLEFLSGLGLLWSPREQDFRGVCVSTPVYSGSTVLYVSIFIWLCLCLFLLLTDSLIHATAVYWVPAMCHYLLLAFGNISIKSIIIIELNRSISRLPRMFTVVLEWQ